MNTVQRITQSLGEIKDKDEQDRLRNRIAAENVWADNEFRELRSEQASPQHDPAAGEFRTIAQDSAIPDKWSKPKVLNGPISLVNVTSQYLTEIARLVDGGKRRTNVGAVLPLADAREAHFMLERVRPQPKGKIVLAVEAS